VFDIFLFADDIQTYELLNAVRTSYISLKFRNDDTRAQIATGANCAGVHCPTNNLSSVLLKPWTQNVISASTLTDRSYKPLQFVANFSFIFWFRLIDVVVEVII
jgi:hypothetical protein